MHCSCGPGARTRTLTAFGPRATGQINRQRWGIAAAVFIVAGRCVSASTTGGDAQPAFTCGHEGAEPWIAFARHDLRCGEALLVRQIETGTVSGQKFEMFVLRAFLKHHVCCRHASIVLRVDVGAAVEQRLRCLEVTPADRGE